MDHLSEPISEMVHLPIYRLKTKSGIIWSIDMTRTIRLRYRKTSPIEFDIGSEPIDPDIGLKDQIGRRTAAMVPERIGLPEKRTMFGTIRYRKLFQLIRPIPPGRPISIPYSGQTDIEPMVDRFGKQSAPECRSAFCRPYPGTDTKR